MQSAHLVRVESDIVRTARVQQVEGMFDVPHRERVQREWEFEMPLDERDWSIGLIVGPSGSGKTTVARAIFGDRVIDGFDWPEKKSVIDGFDRKLSIKDVTGALSSVGFSSPPSWIVPFDRLSTGEQFRATMARALVENENEIVVIDEFTSVVDRRVAKICSAAIEKAARRRGQKLVAVTCHYDVEEWLRPDWVYQPASNEFFWRSLQRRPQIKLDVSLVNRSAWRLFAVHHYLDANLAKASRCFIATVDGAPAAFTAVLSFPHATRPGWREHRTVALPDFQGVGIGNAMSEYIAAIYTATGKPYRSTTSHPAMIAHRNRSPLWKMTSAPKRKAWHEGILKGSGSGNRLTASFEFVGEANVDGARAFGLI